MYFSLQISSFLFFFFASHFWTLPCYTHIFCSTSSSFLFPLLEIFGLPIHFSFVYFSTILFFNNSQFPHLFLHFPPPTKFLQFQFCGSNPSPFGPAHQSRVHETDPASHFTSPQNWQHQQFRNNGSVHCEQKLPSSQKFINRKKIAEITILFSWSGFGVLEPTKLQSSASLAFGALTSKLCCHWSLRQAQPSVSITLSGERNKEGLVWFATGSYIFGLPHWQC